MMYLFITDAGLVQQEEEPTEQDYESVSFGIVDIIRVTCLGVYQQYDPVDNSWKDVYNMDDEDILTTDQQ